MDLKRRGSQILLAMPLLAVVFSSPGVGSIIRPDPCDISIKLSSSNKTIQLEAWGLFLFRYHAQIFVSAAADETQSSKTNIYKVTRSGFELVCEKLLLEERTAGNARPDQLPG